LSALGRNTSLASEAPALAALITAAVAVVGVTLTAIFNTLSSRDADRERKSLALHEASKRLSSASDPKRAAAMAAVVEHLRHPSTAASARRIALNALHYDAEPLVVELAVDQIKDAGHQRRAAAELVHLNRHLWRGVLDQFGRVLAGGPYDQQSISAELEKLSYNQAILSRLLEGQTVSEIDFTGTFYPALWAPEVGFVRCDFRSALLHYSNLRGARFEDCTLDRAILIGAYLEETTFLRSSAEDLVAFGARLSARTEPSAPSPDGLPGAGTGLARSFLYEFEQEWRGHWTAHADEDTFEAVWWNQSDTVEAEVVARDNAFDRTRSTDGNNGVYRIDRVETLDPQRQVVLLGGTHSLARRMPSVWRAVWWKEPDTVHVATPEATAKP
jgi:hypothetical protein